jgi:hypothetical protein
VDGDEKSNDALDPNDSYSDDVSVYLGKTRFCLENECFQMF